MKLFDLFSESDFSEQVAAKMVKEQPHPKYPLAIINYTRGAIFTPEKWNHVTDTCRGLIYDTKSLELIARPFEKFWNYGDGKHPETLPENLPSTLPTITRKLDGSLGIAYRYAGDLHVATRGSFTRTQAVWATKWLQAHGMADWREGWTPLFEIVYPENQIVVRYDWSGLILLAAVNNETGAELNADDLAEFGKINDLQVVESFDQPLAALAVEDVKNEEGYVASWPRDGRTPLRVKIKYLTYRRLHRLLTQCSPISIWEMLRDGDSLDEYINDVPQEFIEWVKSIEGVIQAEYSTVEGEAQRLMEAYSGPSGIENRKEFAAYATQTKLAPILFAMLDGKDVAPIIYKMIRPNGQAQTFKVDEE